ncbi:MAG: hypothetical protein QY331_09630 [Melioribacteraceae bacterium]|nr:MAG: hypothetical protein QY331_09630 [Melioribacteraceae bacterium]
MDSISFWDSIQFGEECAMHSPKVEEVSCCESETDELSTLMKYIDNCCQDLIVDNSIKDTFLSSKTQLNIANEVFSLLSSESFDTELNLTRNEFFNVHSPPLISSNKIYLSISVFLI